MKFERYFTANDESIEWNKRDICLKDKDGNIVFERKNVKAPSFWSDRAVTIAASKYFQEHENSIHQLIIRVVDGITNYGWDNYFDDAESAEIFRSELYYILVHQLASFNSPVWFNLGATHSKNHKLWSYNPQSDKIEEFNASHAPQCSACFIQSVDDTLDDIMSLATKQAKLYKFGSGTGTNYSTLRSSKEQLSGGGTPSGPLSFMKIFDSVGEVVMSGGRARRAASMCILNDSHPDIMEFIKCKADEENKARMLINGGMDPQEAYKSTAYQNANHSVSITDAFMRAVENDEEWVTYNVTDGKPCETFKARDIFRAIAEAAWKCGDPGVQFIDTMNRFNPTSVPYTSTNPCSEYIFLDNSACNLACINLAKVSDKDIHAIVRLLITAQDIIVDLAGYPTKEIAQNSHDYRPLGLGFTGLGERLMAQHCQYEGIGAKVITENICSEVYLAAIDTSMDLAEELGPYAKIESELALKAIVPILKKCTDDHIYIEEVSQTIRNKQLRNAQLTLSIPAGTVSFMMDANTTGIEPELALVKTKRLTDGGVLETVNPTIPIALKWLRYTEEEIEKICEYVVEKKCISSAPNFKKEHRDIFLTAFPSPVDGKCLSTKAHLDIMQAVQERISGSISKTVNVPNNATVEDIEEIYMDAWKRGLKSIAIYRDGCKQFQPVVTQKEEGEPVESLSDIPRKMPDTRKAEIHKFVIGGHTGYLHMGLYEDGSLGEIFITMAKEGSTLGGLLDAFGIAISMGLQYGVPLDVLVKKFVFTHFEPNGYTKNPDIQRARSIIDYIFRYIAKRFLNKEISKKKDLQDTTPSGIIQEKGDISVGPPCPECECTTVMRGTCYVCDNCGTTSGCS